MILNVKFSINIYFIEFGLDNQFKILYINIKKINFKV